MSGTFSNLVRKAEEVAFLLVPFLVGSFAILGTYIVATMQQYMGSAWIDPAFKTYLPILVLGCGLTGLSGLLCVGIWCYKAQEPRYQVSIYVGNALASLIVLVCLLGVGQMAAQMLR